MSRSNARTIRLALLAGTAAAVTAQSAFAAEATAEANEITEVIVTAQKREERVLDVPISMTALGGETLQRARVTDVQGLARVVPGFTYEDSLISSGARARIRGIGSPTFTSGETSVSVSLDGVVTGPTGSGLSNMFDVTRVEVLRGPQGTLFGKNATAGAVAVVSRAPTSSFEAYVNVSQSFDDFSDGTDFTTTRTEGAISGPLGENTRARFAFFTRVDGEGAAYNNFLRTDENRRNQWGSRLSLAHVAGPLSLDLRVSYIETADRCCGPTFREVDPTATTLGNVPLLLRLAAQNNITISKKNRDSMASDRVGEETQTVHATLQGDYDLGNGFSIRSITGARKWSSYGEDDSERLAVNLADATFGNITLNLFTQELQLLSPQDGPFKYVIGLYYYNQKLQDAFGVGGALGTANPIQALSIATSLNRVKNYAAFANGTWRFAESWELLGGLRILYEDQSLEGVRTGSFFGPNRPFNRIEADDTDWVGRLGVRYNPNSDTSVFLTASRGYKGAGLNNSNSGPFFSPLNNADPILKPETVTNYELGTKNRWMEGRLQTNVVAYYSKFKDFQTSAFDGASNTFSLRNAGEIEIKGIEIDATAQPWTGGYISFGAAWTDAEFSDFRGAPCTALQTARRECPPTGQDLSGRKVDGNPEWQLSLIGRQDFDLGSVEAYATVEYSWRSEVNYNSDLDPMLVQDDYSLVNLRLGANLNDNIEVVGFVENLFDQEYALRISPAPLLPGVSSHYMAPGRIFGVELRYTY
jgi:iron complex outermembrane receptor protein